MKRYASGAALIAGLALFANSLWMPSYGAMIGVAALILSILWVWSMTRALSWSTGFFVLSAFLAAASATSTGGWALPALSITAALYAWDAAHAAERLRGLPKDAQWAIVRPYILTGVALAAGGLALTSVAMVVHFEARFGTLVALILLLSALAWLFAFLGRLPKGPKAELEALKKQGEQEEEAERMTSPGLGLDSDSESSAGSD